MNIKFKAGGGIRDIGSGQVARMPTPGLKLRKKSWDLFKEI